jgi:SMP-30/Gluconolactonase/LRE-like region
MTDLSSPAFSLALNQITWLGSGLVRPECVLAYPSGTLVTSDWRSGVAITQQGNSVLVSGALANQRPLRPNGIAPLPNGSWLLADLGDTHGGVFTLSQTGEVSPFLTAVDGLDLPPTNFVCVDHQGRTWITVSTRATPRSRSYRPDTRDGFIIVVDERGARVVADALGYTNELLVTPDGCWLYVNETFARCLTRYRITPNNELVERTVITRFGSGTFPDGLAMDETGALWVVSIVSNRLIRVFPDGSQHLVLEDAPPEHVSWVEAAFQAGTMGREHLDQHPAAVLRNISSIAFGGHDLRTIYLGCLLGDSIASLPVPVAGIKPSHWCWPRKR